MKKNILKLKKFFRLYSLHRQGVLLESYLSSSEIVDLNTQEKDYVNMQTDRMLMRKSARQRRLDPARDWTALLQPMPERGSAYALHVGR
ncbi:MAG: hypothetical protein IJ311_04980 [Elusimicrobiaceae bacterium]|nr:hypothetical protein [Elusimicrobiaceae bacterium]